ncbi:uncharacterized protein CCR75_009791 [Bremia lactucae]|uniref:Uncharacterized protein n=1 Tax=Bremia lactucae TaxID=4779 RepID=A0A976IE36_BRELC|nr:hypothetical protein CCR75_009791 [Bremia lactucae]
METQPSPPETKSDERVTVLALREAGRPGAIDLSQSDLELKRYSRTGPIDFGSARSQPSASGIRDVAQQGGLLGASRSTLQDLHQCQRVQTEANQFAQGSLYAQAARHQGHHQPTQPEQVIVVERYHRGVAQFGTAWVAVPDCKTSRRMIQQSTGKELLARLGIGFREWSNSFLEALEMAEFASEFQWAGRVKVNKLGDFLEK